MIFQYLINRNYVLKLDLKTCDIIILHGQKQINKQV